MSVRVGPNDIGGQDCECPDIEVWCVLTWVPKSWPNYRDIPNLYITDIYLSEQAARGSIPSRAAGRDVVALDAVTYMTVQEGWKYRVVRVAPRCGHKPIFRNVRPVTRIEVIADLLQQEPSDED